MSIPSVSRRERLRHAAVAEIKAHARELLVSGGSSAVSLRAIAREMGMTAPAIYRYFPSLDALVAELTEDLYDELRVSVERARDEGSDPLSRLGAMARAFRHWSINNPAEFGLMFGNPIPGVASFEGDCVSPEHAGAKFGAPFIQAFGELWNIRHFPTPPHDVIEVQLAPHLSPYQAAYGADLPIEVIWAYLSAWLRLYGLVALEVFGHLQWAVDSVEPLFELELASFVAQFS